MKELSPVRWRNADGSSARALAETDLSSPGMLDIIDQTLLPGKLERLCLCDENAVFDAIRRLAVRGAPAIGCAAALGLASCVQRLSMELSLEEFRKKIRKIADHLASSRPTAVNLFWALDRCLKTAEKEYASPLECSRAVLTEGMMILEEDILLCRRIGEAGNTLIPDGAGILTHCNAGALATAGMGTALAPVYAAFSAGKKIHVYSDETRPLLQGARLTAWELAYHHVPVTAICDSMASQVMREGKIDLVIVGADRVAANGDAANKIGTFQVAIAAKYHHIPFYVVLPCSTIDRSLADGSLIPIEQRSPDEIVFFNGKRNVPEGVGIYNPAFDVTPAELISGYITERGVLDKP